MNCIRILTGDQWDWAWVTRGNGQLDNQQCVAFSHSPFNNSCLSLLNPGIISKINYLHASCWLCLKYSVWKHLLRAPCPYWLPLSSPNHSILKLERLRASCYTWRNWAPNRLSYILWSHSWIETDMGVGLCSGFFWLMIFLFFHSFCFFWLCVGFQASWASNRKRISDDKIWPRKHWCHLVFRYLRGHGKLNLMRLHLMKGKKAKLYKEENIRCLGDRWSR